MKTTLLNQIRERREALGLKIQEMPLRAGLTRQQYGKIEAGGNPRLNTLDQIAEGLDSVLLLVPKDKVDAVKRALASDEPNLHGSPTPSSVQDDLFRTDDVENPWGAL